MPPSILIILIAALVIPLTFILLKPRSAGTPGYQPGPINWILILNTAILYSLAYNLVFFLQELFLVLGKNAIGLRSVLYHNNHNWFDYHPREALMQGSGAAAIFLFGLLCLAAYYFAGTKGWLKMFIFWLTFQALSQSLAQFATAIISPETDTGQAMAFFEFPVALQIAITILSASMFLFLVARAGRELNGYADSTSLEKKRVRSLRELIIFGVLAGVVLIIPFRLPPVTQIMGPVFLVILTLPAVFAFALYSPGKIKRKTLPGKILPVASVALLLLLLFFQLILAKGVEFLP